MDRKRDIKVDPFETMRVAYMAVMEETWKTVGAELKDGRKIAFPMTIHDDTALHLAVYSGVEEPTKGLLAVVSEREEAFWKNSVENTPLHEAATVGNLAAVKLLVEYNKQDLLERNIYKETPLYRAAKYGRLEIVEYILDDCEDIFSRSPLNWTQADGIPIIHAAMDSGNFEVVLKLVDFDKSLLEMTDEQGKTALQVLANMPHAFPSGYTMTFWESIIYDFLPSKDIFKCNFSYHGSCNNDFESFNMKNKKNEDLEADNSGSFNMKNKKNEDLEAGSNRPNCCSHSNCWRYFVHCLTFIFWKFILLGWPQCREMHENKRRHKSALTLTKMLAQIDYSWYRGQPTKPENTKVDSTGVHGSSEGKKVAVKVHGSSEGKKGAVKVHGSSEGKKGAIEVDSTGVHGSSEGKKGGKNNNVDIVKEKEKVEIVTEKENVELVDIKKHEFKDHHETPLLLAAANGIKEVVEKIVEAHPQAIDYVTEQQRNILHVAILHRQKTIFEWIEKRGLLMSRLVKRIDAMGFTILHCVAITKFSRSETHGPALELQHELKWYQRVQKQIPELYTVHHSNKETNNRTARDLFEETHKDMSENAKEWLKKTSESCSAVAVLVATVVFAAAYTVPGGLNSKTGSPVLLTEPIFIVFTVMDVIALASALTSVVLFLSILTSSFQMGDFLHVLPLKLSIGFQLLFVSVASTMMVFALTIVLTVKSEQMKWTVVLLYVATFFPVTMFIIIQLPLYLELVKNLWDYRHILFKFLPVGFVIRSWKAPPKFLTRKAA